MRTIYGIHGNDNITFLTLEAAEEWLMNEYPEFCWTKDIAYDFCEQMIWEEAV